jgi:beta-lactamase regulating signal transducer with metallopeptidase domain
MNPFFGLFFKLTLLLFAAWGIAHVLRRQAAAARHLVWLLALYGALLLPLASSMMPVLPVRVLQPLEAVTERGGPVSNQTLVAQNNAALPQSGAGDRAAPMPAKPGAASGVIGLPLADLAVALWLLGSLLVLLACGLGHVGLLRLVRRATRLEDPEWHALVTRIARASGIRKPVRLYCSPAVGSPVVWGVRPRVLLPVDAADWPVERRRVVLAHELAHAARGDFLAQLVGNVVCALFWFHPLVWLAARRLRLESERACDDQVLLLGMPGSEYAGHLLEVARRSSALRLGGVIAIGMARPSHLEGRLLAVLDEARTRHAPPSRARRIAWAGLLLMILPLSGLRPAPRLPSTEGQPSAPVMAVTVASVQRDSSFEHEVAAAPGGELVIDLESGGSILVRGWDSPRVRVSGHLAGASWRDTRVSLERTGRGARLYASQEQRRGTTSTSHEFEIMVPRRFDLTLNSAGGDVSIVGVEGRFRGETGGGSIVIERAGGRAELSTGGGDIRVADSELDGTVSTGGGEVRLFGVRGGLRGSSGSGPVMTRDEGGSLDDVRVNGDRIRIEKQRAKEEKVRADQLKSENWQKEFEGRQRAELEELEKRKTDVVKELENRRGEAKELEKRKNEAISELKKRRLEDTKEIEKRLTATRQELEELRAEERKGLKRGEKDWTQDRLEPGALHIEKAGGAILLESAPQGGSLKTGGGRIEVGESAGLLEVSTGGGDITIGPHAGSLRAGTGAGTVEVVITDGDGNERSVQIESGSGSAVITLPASFSGRFELETAYTNRFGRRTRIESDWGLEQEETDKWDDQFGTPRKYVRARGQAGSGAGLIRIHIVNGDITIRKGGS